MRLEKHDFPRVELTIKNEGSAPVAFYDDDMPGWAFGIVTRQMDGTIVKTLFEAQFSPGQQYNGTRTVSKLLPNESLTRDYFSLYAKAADAKTAAFEGTVKPIGAPVTTQFHCGPVPFKA
jgi:hypothetical protein